MSQQVENPSAAKPELLELTLEEKGIELPEETSALQAFPLSFSQQRLWFLDQFEPGNPSYNQMLAVRLIGRLDMRAFQLTFQEIVSRHETLRTNFRVVDGQPSQIISDDCDVGINVVNASEADTANRIITEEALRPFDLASDRLLRVNLIRLGDEEHIVVLMMHHIIGDGWSMGVLISELSELYTAYTNGREPQLAELTVQYADYATWQREWLQGEVLEEQLQYWRKSYQARRRCWSCRRTEYDLRRRVMRAGSKSLRSAKS